jgi:hypothetical protein
MTPTPVLVTIAVSVVSADFHADWTRTDRNLALSRRCDRHSAQRHQSKKQLPHGSDLLQSSHVGNAGRGEMFRPRQAITRVLFRGAVIAAIELFPD